MLISYRQIQVVLSRFINADFPSDFQQKNPQFSSDSNSDLQYFKNLLFMYS